MTPLGVACGGREVDKMETLVRKSLNRKSTDAELAMRRLSGVQATAATIPEQFPIVEKLLEAGADLNTGSGTHGATPLMCAAGLGHVNVVRCLLSRGADVNAKDSKGATALLKAAALGNRECVELLINSGADKDVVDDQGVSPVMASVIAGHADTLWALLAAGASPNGLRNTDGAAPLHVSSASGRQDLVSALVACGADPDILNNDGESPVFLAAALGRSEVVKVLGKSSACLHTKNNEGYTPLMIALSNGHVHVANALLDTKKNLDLNARLLKNGTTALGLALALEEKAGCLLYRLMVSGADPFALAGKRGPSSPRREEEEEGDPHRPSASTTSELERSIKIEGKVSVSARGSLDVEDVASIPEEGTTSAVEEQEQGPLPAVCSLAAAVSSEEVGADQVVEPGISLIEFNMAVE